MNLPKCECTLTDPFGLVIQYFLKALNGLNISSIPLNDEFLTAFGKREKEYDELAGRVVDIDKKSLDVNVSESEDEENSSKLKKSKEQKLNFSEMANCKVRFPISSQYLRDFAFLVHPHHIH